MSTVIKSLALAVASVAIIAGCEEKQPSSTEPGTTGGVMQKAQESAKSTAGAVTEKSKEASAAGSDAMAALTKQAEDLYNKAKTAIEGGKLEEAKPLLAQLTAMQDKLPVEWRTKIKDLVELAKTRGMDAVKGMIPGTK